MGIRQACKTNLEWRIHSGRPGGLPRILTSFSLNMINLFHSLWIYKHKFRLGLEWGSPENSCNSSACRGPLTAFVPENRLLQCFETLPSKSPDQGRQNTLTWFQQGHLEQAVLKDLRAQPSAPPAINYNWQVVKEFAMKAGIDTSRLECSASLRILHPCMQTYTYRLWDFSGSYPTPAGVE